jgi:hypothetical protein
MDWAILLSKILEIILIPLAGYAAAELIKFIKIKRAEIIAKTDDATTQKYLDMLGDTVILCVETTNQTYVDALKKAGSFDAEAQKEAFKKTYTAILDILTDEAKDYLTNIVGDFDAFLKNKIESTVKESKK